MKSMKRLFTLMMALVMVLSCTAVVSAAEISENGSTAVSYEISSQDDGIMPLAMEYLIKESGSLNKGKSKTYTSSAVTQQEDVWLFFDCTKLCRVEVYVVAGFQSKLLYGTDVEGGNSLARGITATLPKGAKIRAKVIAKEDGCNYNVTLRGTY